MIDPVLPRVVLFNILITRNQPAGQTAANGNGRVLHLMIQVGVPTMRGPAALLLNSTTGSFWHSRQLWHPGGREARHPNDCRVSPPSPHSLRRSQRLMMSLAGTFTAKATKIGSWSKRLPSPYSPLSTLIHTTWVAATP